MSLIFLLFTSLIFANPASKWESAKVSEKHEFYENYEVVDKPQNTWQFLFAVDYKNSGYKLTKDCLFYRIPGEKMGALKIITTETDRPCNRLIFQKAEQEWNDIRALQYAIEDHRILVQITFKNFELELWDVPIFLMFKNPEPKMNMSSAEYRSSKIIFLRPHSSNDKFKFNGTKKIKDGDICHAISEDCKEISKSECMKCAQGWFEIPNGCKQSPKYCGVHLCGLKNRPACRRGLHYTGAEKKFDCRTDSSFAYCAKGLMIQCQGHLAYCL